MLPFNIKSCTLLLPPTNFRTFIFTLKKNVLHFWFALQSLEFHWCLASCLFCTTCNYANLLAALQSWGFPCSTIYLFAIYLILATTSKLQQPLTNSWENGHFSLTGYDCQALGLCEWSISINTVIVTPSKLQERLTNQSGNSNLSIADANCKLVTDQTSLCDWGLTLPWKKSFLSNTYRSKFQNITQAQHIQQLLLLTREQTWY